MYSFLAFHNFLLQKNHFKVPATDSVAESLTAKKCNSSCCKKNPVQKLQH
jgi:hypothetical protein